MLELGKDIMVLNIVKRFDKVLIKMLDLETNNIIEIVIFHQQRAIIMMAYYHRIRERHFGTKHCDQVS